MCLQHVSLQVVELLITHSADFLPAARLEDLVSDPQVLVEVGDLLAALGAGVSLLEVNVLDVTVVIGFLVRLVITLIALVLERGGRGGLQNLQFDKVIDKKTERCLYKTWIGRDCWFSVLMLRSSELYMTISLSNSRLDNRIFSIILVCLN